MYDTGRCTCCKKKDENGEPMGNLLIPLPNKLPNESDPNGGVVMVCDECDSVPKGQILKYNL